MKAIDPLAHEQSQTVGISLLNLMMYRDGTQPTDEGLSRSQWIRLIEIELLGG